MKYDVATPYTASYVLVRRAHTIAFVLRENTSWMNGYYGLPSGKVEKNESFTAAAVREAKEEIGITIQPLDLRHVLTMQRIEASDADDENIWIDIFFEVAKWGGEPYNAEPHVHSELAWLDPHKLPENTISSVRFAIEQIEASNAFTEFGW
jgi:8-oxo-dGTP diphosphatase